MRGGTEFDIFFRYKQHGPDQYRGALKKRVDGPGQYGHTVQFPDTAFEAYCSCEGPLPPATMMAQIIFVIVKFLVLSVWDLLDSRLKCARIDKEARKPAVRIQKKVAAIFIQAPDCWLLYSMFFYFRYSSFFGAAAPPCPWCLHRN